MRSLNSENCAVLLSKYQPKVIETEAENEAAIVLAEELEHKRLRTPEEDTLLELLVTLIEKFEQEQYPLSQADPHSMLLHLMDVQNTKEEDLIGVIGADKDAVFEVFGVDIAKLSPGAISARSKTGHRFLKEARGGCVLLIKSHLVRPEISKAPWS